MRRDTPLNGYLDRLGENLDVLDESIANARAMSKAKKSGDSRTALQWAKTLRDLVELRDRTLTNFKAHILGRDETGTVTEPPDFYDSDPEVMFERDFKRFLAPWTRDDLKLECEDCGLVSEQVSPHYFPEILDPRTVDTIAETETADLCAKCYAKRMTERSKLMPAKNSDDTDSDDYERTTESTGESKDAVLGGVVKLSSN